MIASTTHEPRRGNRAGSAVGHRRIAHALDALARAFGRPRRDRHFSPLDELVLTVLSQNTNDANRDRAFASLKTRFPTWAMAARAPVRALESAIRRGGLARIKSQVIRDLLRRIERERTQFDLEFLRSIPLDQARAWLRSFRGVGDKTAACVLLFACNRPAFPVDTHILRVARRLGWIRPRCSAVEAHTMMEELIPQARYFEAHVNLIALGRRHCRPHHPDCGHCPLSRLCPSSRIPEL